MLRLLFLIILPCFIFVKDAQACSCARTPLPGPARDVYFEKQAQHADYIFLATVTEERDGTIEFKKFWDFKVEKIWKGTVEPAFTYESSQEMCSRGYFKTGETYLVYATTHQKDDTNNTYDISSCSYTRIAAEAEEAIAKLDADLGEDVEAEEKAEEK